MRARFSSSLDTSHHATTRGLIPVITLSGDDTNTSYGVCCSWNGQGIMQQENPADAFKPLAGTANGLNEARSFATAGVIRGGLNRVCVALFLELHRRESEKASGLPCAHATAAGGNP
jgi:hypothetical protein